ncbi:hypothetical protein GOODEAATRI_002752 [Goodea atripinnis]|uniref:Ig-like domain-containing protein n=1 Tax=Goodea atripinnis TaxID=208336 RepID=A0ABV0N077_9TELE
MLTPHLLSLALLLSLTCLASSRSVSEDMVEVSSVSGQSSALECTAKHKPGVRYISVRWYKLESYPSLQRSGLLTRSLPNGTTRWYKDATREVHLQGESRDIFLPNMTCSDSGVYLCYLAAPVGEQNQEGKVLLTLTVSAACSDEKRNKHENKQGEWSASKHEEPKTSVSEDIDALLEELLEDDYSSSPQSKLRCISCDFRVLMFDDSEWDASCDYLFLR